MIIWMTLKAWITWISVYSMWRNSCTNMIDYSWISFLKLIGPFQFSSLKLRICDVNSIWSTCNLIKTCCDMLLVLLLFHLKFVLDFNFEFCHLLINSNLNTFVNYSLNTFSKIEWNLIHINIML